MTPQFNATIVCSLLALCLFSNSGCGSAEYERGLNKTAGYFAHVNKMNENLSMSEWKGSGISIRVPEQFNRVRSSANSEGEDENTSIKDPRQPGFIDVELPGLLETWKASVNVDDEDGSFPAYIYLLSNTALGEGDSSDIVSDFTSEVTQRLVDGLQVEFPEEWNTQEIPHKRGYVEKKSFTTTTLEPENPVKFSSDSEAIVQVEIYLAKKSDSHTAIIFLYPQAISDSEKLSDKILLSLESFEMRGGSARSSSGSSGKSSGSKKRSKKKRPSVGF